MATPESIVTSLDWSKKLKEVGWPQGIYEGGQFYWRHGNLISIHEEDAMFMLSRSPLETEEPFAAPTAKEILRRLPGKWEVFQNDIGPTTKEIIVSCFTGGEQHDTPGIHETLANAAAAMYCYLAEQKLLKNA